MNLSKDTKSVLLLLLLFINYSRNDDSFYP